MTAPMPLKKSHFGVWGRRFALYFLLLLLLTAALHYLSLLGTRAAINLLAVCFVGLVTALCLTGVALFRIWRGNYRTTGDPLFAFVFAAIGLAPFLWFGGQALQRPALSDVTTTPARHIPLKDLTARPEDANPVTQPKEWEIAAQQEAYPDIQPLVLERSPDELFALTREAMRRLNWEIVVEEPPAGSTLGYLQAQAHTMFMGFTDDVAVEVIGDDIGTSSVNVRSISRYGSHDLGVNAARIAALFDEIREGVKKGERPVLETTEDGIPFPRRKTPR